MENFFKINRYRAATTKWLAVASSLVYAFSHLVPGLSLSHSFHSTLDDSWKQTLHVAFEQHWQFGRDIIFTFGPWGFLGGGYYPPTFAISVIAWTVLSFIFWLGCWRMAHHCFKCQSSAWLWMMGFIGVAGLPAGQSLDVRLVAWVLILLSLHFFANEQPFSITKILVVVSLGWLGLTKFTGMMMATVVVLMIAGDEVLRHRRFPWIIFVFAASVLCFWLAAGQELGSLLPFFSNAWQITSGYTEAVMWGGNQELSAALLFLLVTAMVSLPIAYTGFAKHRYFGILPLSGLGFIVLIVFKHGFVRHDNQHEIEAVLPTLLIALMALAVSWPVLRTKGPRFVLMELLLLDVALVYAGFSFKACVGKGLLVQFAETFEPRRLLSSGILLYNSDDLRTAYENYLAGIRKASPLPQIKGDVDVYPWDQDVVFAYGLHYRPRPIFQSYSAYTPKLAKLNATYLHDGHAAENILFNIETIDGRFPSLDDSRSWPELLTRYDINKVMNDFVLLKRSATPRKYQLVPIKDVPIHFGKPVELPPTTQGPVWAEIKIDKTFLGSIACLFYKPPILDLTVFLGNGRHSAFRLIPGMARSGFLLSPLIRDKASFVSLALTGTKQNLTNWAVTAITIHAATRSGSTICYESTMQLRLFRLDFTRQNADETRFGKELHRTPQVFQNPNLQ